MKEPRCIVQITIGIIVYGVCIFIIFSINFFVVYYISIKYLGHDSDERGTHTHSLYLCINIDLCMNALKLARLI